MTRKGLMGIGVLTLLVAGRVGAQAPQGRLWFVHQEMAKPSMLAEYNATTLEVMKLAAKVKVPTLGKSVVLEGDDLTFTIAMPIADLNGAAAVNDDFATMAKSDPKYFADLLKRGWAPVESVREFVLMEQPEMSYVPAKPYLDPAAARFYHYDIYYVMPGHEDEGAAIARDFAALFKAKGVTQAYRIFTVVNGPEMPAIVVETPAKDGADYYSTTAAVQAQLGEAGRALFGRAYAHSRRIEHRNAMLRPDLSPSLWPAAGH